MAEGKIVYSITDLYALKMKVNDSTAPTDNIFRFKHSKQRMDVLKYGKLRVTLLYNDSTSEITTMIEPDVRKTAVVESYHSTERESLKLPKKTFKYLDESKIICGYKCFKAEYKVENDTNRYYVYYTKDFLDTLPFFVKDYFDDLVGYPMEYNMEISMGSLIYTATKIEKEKIDDSLFEIPKEYKIIH